MWCVAVIARTNRVTGENDRNLRSGFQYMELGLHARMSLTTIRRKVVSPISAFTQGRLPIKRNHGFFIIRGSARTEQAENCSIRFAGQGEIVDSPLFEIASVLVSFDHAARFIVNADHDSCERL